MKSIFLFSIGLLALFVISCNKNSNDPPPPSFHEYFKLKTIKSTSMFNGAVNSTDSTSIIIDSVNNKIIFKSISNSYKSDTSIFTYSYNSKNQLELYERIDTYDRFYLSRMQFIRNEKGELTKVLSEYKNGLMASSEGICRYEKRGDTTCITFIDSALKDPHRYSDAQDHYQIGIVNERLVYYKNYFMRNNKLDSSEEKFIYDASGSIASRTHYYKNETPSVYNYQHATQPATELQKFIARLGGDLVWFTRAKQFGFLTDIGGDYYLMGNVLQSITKNNAPYQTYSNEFDSNGNLKKLSYTFTTPSGERQRIQEFDYRP